jgi:hypothetical protein
MILSNLPDQLLLGQTCRKLYDVSCSLEETYSLTIRTKNLDGDPNMKVTKFLEDESIFSSIVNSKRRIDDLKLLYLCLSPPNNQKLLKIIETFGPHIKQLIVINCRLSMFEISLLNSMPQLKFIALYSVQPQNLRSLRNFRWNWPMLRSFSLFKCSEKVLEIFNDLPDDVLMNVCFVNTHAQKAGKFFANQRNLKTLVVKSSSFNAQDIKHLNFTKLITDFAGEELKSMLHGQNLLSLGIESGISQSDFNYICSHLYSLHELIINTEARNLNFSELEQLKKLRKLHLEFSNEANLPSVKSNSVKTLKIILAIEILSEEDAASLSTNCPNVVDLEIRSCHEGDDINWSLQYFPQLETFTCGYINDEYVYPNDLEHQNLKKLKISSFDLSVGLFFLFSRLENLEVFKTEMQIDWKDLQTILGAPKLKALCLKQFPVVDEDFIRIMTKHGMNLESFHVAIKEEDDDEIGLSPEELREKFKDQFPIFSFKDGRMWIMKKSNKPMICCHD